MRVEQLNNKNQFKIWNDNGWLFQSYDSICAGHINGQTYFVEGLWYYSKTTLKHLKLALRMDISKKELKKEIKKGAIIVVSEEELNRLFEKTS